MPNEVFEVGDRVFLTPSKHFGTIVTVTIETPHKAPDAVGVRRYAIKLDDGGTINGVYRGIEHTTH